MSDTMIQSAYVIRSKNLIDINNGNPLYWSNELGWTGRRNADTFSDSQVRSMPAPMGGDWEKA